MGSRLRLKLQIRVSFASSLPIIFMQFVNEAHLRLLRLFAEQLRRHVGNREDRIEPGVPATDNGVPWPRMQQEACQLCGAWNAEKKRHADTALQSRTEHNVPKASQNDCQPPRSPQDNRVTRLDHGHISGRLITIPHRNKTQLQHDMGSQQNNTVAVQGMNIEILPQGRIKFLGQLTTFKTLSNSNSTTASSARVQFSPATDRS